MKKKTVAKVKKDVWVVFSKYIRMRDCLKTTGSLDYGECISCGVTKPIRLLDAGHFVPKRSNNYFSQLGVNAQCQSCNRFHGGNQLGYRRGLVELYGEEMVKILELENMPIKKFTIPELKELEQDLLANIQLLEEGK